LALPAAELVKDQDWRALARCAEIDPDLWFAVGAREHKLAKKVCRACPVRTECLEYAMDVPVDHGIWGGMTERERRRYRRLAGSAGWRALIPRS
jgi:WhiB family redox-sensing transcriptional regulator